MNEPLKSVPGIALNLYIYLRGVCFYDPHLPVWVGGEELGTEKWSNKAKITQVVREARLRTQALWFSLHGAAA